MWARMRRKQIRSRRICTQTSLVEYDGKDTIMIVSCNRRDVPMDISVLGPHAARVIGEHLVDFADRKERMDWQDYEKEDED